MAAVSHCSSSIAIAAALLVFAPARADDISDFYRGKTVTMHIPAGPGGGYDSYARLVARHIGKHIPGNPAINPQNVPGAGGLISANLFANTTARDGLHIAILENGVPFRPAFDARQVRYDIKQFRWLGSVTNIGTAAIVSRKSDFLNAQDVMTREPLIGTSGGNTIDIPQAINRIIGTKFKLVKGYRGTNEVLLAMEKGEVAGIVGVGFDTLMTNRGGNLECCRALMQTGQRRDRDFPDVPLVSEFARTPEQKAVLEVAFAGLDLGRSFVTGDIAPERLDALRRAFAATLTDAEFVTDARRQHLPVNPMTATQSEAIVAKFYAQPETIVAQARKALAPEDN